MHLSPSPLCRWSGFPLRFTSLSFCFCLPVYATDVAQVHTGFFGTLHLRCLLSSHLPLKSLLQNEILGICVRTIIYPDYQGFWYDLVGGICHVLGKKMRNSDKMLVGKSSQLFQVEHCKIYSK